MPRADDLTPDLLHATRGIRRLSKSGDQSRVPGGGAVRFEPSVARSALANEMKAILGTAKSQGDRELTRDELARYHELDHLVRKQDDADLMQAVDDTLGGTGPLGRRAASGRGYGWGAAVVKASSDALGRFKDLAPSGGAPVTVPVEADPVREGEPLTTMRQLIPSKRNTSGAFAYLRQTERDNAAAAVPPGGLKPTSNYSTERVDDRVRVIAHLSEPIDRSTLSDAPLLEQFVNDEMRLGLELEAERLILAGSGTGEEFAGLDHTSGVQVQAWSTDLLTTTREAITKLEVLGLAGTGWVLAPQDWMRVELLANEQGYTLTQAGESVPVQRAARRLWGLPVAVSASAPAGVGWLADWTQVELHVREEAQVTWSENMWRPDALGVGLGASDFARNLVAFRCEARMGLAVKRPAGCVRLDLTAA